MTSRRKSLSGEHADEREGGHEREEREDSRAEVTKTAIRYGVGRSLRLNTPVLDSMCRLNGRLADRAASQCSKHDPRQ